jgi:hypothetical protein
MKLKFLLWAAMSLTFTGVFTSCGDEDVMEQVKEEEEKEKEKEKEDEEADEKDEGEEVEDSEEMADIFEFAPISESTVKVIGIKDKFRTEITIPTTIQVYGKEYKVTSLNCDAFNESNVKSVKLAESFTEIPAGMFENCWKLTSIEIPSSVTSIGESAFMDCDLPSIEIPSSVTSIGHNAFAYCYDTDIVIDNSEENVTVAYDAFYNCKSVTWKR